MYEEQYRDFICGYWALKVIVLIIREYSNEYLLSKTFNVLHVVLIDFVLIARQLIYEERKDVAISPLVPIQERIVLFRAKASYTRRWVVRTSDAKTFSLRCCVPFHGVSVVRVIKLTFVTFSFVIILFLVFISLA